MRVEVADERLTHELIECLVEAGYVTHAVTENVVDARLPFTPPAMFERDLRLIVRTWCGRTRTSARVGGEVRSSD